MRPLRVWLARSCRCMRAREALSRARARAATKFTARCAAKIRHTWETPLSVYRPGMCMQRVAPSTRRPSRARTSIGRAHRGNQKGESARARAQRKISLLARRFSRARSSSSSSFFFFFLFVYFSSSFWSRGLSRFPTSPRRTLVKICILGKDSAGQIKRRA